MIPEKFGPFKIGRVLGRGGMGTVYEGTSLSDRSTVAIKVLTNFIDEEENAEVRLRFESEIETLKRLRHPNIVRLSGFGEEHGQLYYVMELVNGSSLQQELRKKRLFQWYEAAKIGLDICQALKHAHDRGVIHRDIKPANILLDKEGNVKLSDFGIARFFGSQQITDIHSIVGTLEFMSPEQALAHPISSTADLYSLGCVLYTLLTGKPPYAAHSLPEMLRKYQSTVPIPIPSFRNDVPDDLGHLVTDLLQIRPEDRPRNAVLATKRLQVLLQALMGTPETIKVLPKVQEPPRQLQESALLATSGEFYPNSYIHQSQSHENVDLLDNTDKAATDFLSSPLPSAQPSPPPLEKSATDKRLVDTKTSSTLWNNLLKPSDVISSTTTLRHGDVLLSNTRTFHPSKDEPLPDASFWSESLRVKSDDSESVEKTAESLPSSSRNEDDATLKPSGTTSSLPTPEQATRFVAVEGKSLDPFENEDRVSRSTVISLPTAVSSTLLMVVGLTIYYLLQPPSPEVLFERITTTIKEDEISSEFSLSLLRSTQKSIQQFLSNYPDHPSAEQVRYYQDELDLLEHERRLDRRTQFSGLRTLSPVERVYVEVLSSSPNDSEQMIEKLRAFIDVFQTGEPSSSEPIRPHRLASNPVEICVELAQRRLKKLEQVVEEINTEQEQMLRRRLEEAANWDYIYPSYADDIRRGIITLYQNHRWAKNVVEEAKQQLEE